MSKQKTPKKITIHPTEKLEQENIVKEFYMDGSWSNVVLELNHEYDTKLITLPLDFDNWEYTLDTFKDILEEQGIRPDHIVMICDSISVNIGELSKSKSNKSNNKSKEIPEIPCYKYSPNGILHEAIIPDGESVFITYDGKKVKVVKSIKEKSRIIIPPEDYPYDAYSFKDLDEVNQYLERVKKISSLDSIYFTFKPIVADYNDQSEQKRILIVIDVIWSYFQDRFPTTRYNVIVGGNGSGKSTEGSFIGATAYRCVNLTNPRDLVSTYAGLFFVRLHKSNSLPTAHSFINSKRKAPSSMDIVALCDDLE